MSKLDKSKYTKEQIQKLLEIRRSQKISDKIQNITRVNEHTHTEYGFVLGNGISRNFINPEQLKPFGKVYGCNAIYREFDPDYLIAVDVKMIIEIDSKRYQDKHPNIWTNPNKAYRNINGINFFKPSKGWSSGPTALWLASQHNYKQIFILGFDYKGINNGQHVNNLYAGTPNYKKVNDPATYYGNWLKQTVRVVKEHPQIMYYRVITPDNFQPGELNSISNLKTIYTEDFKKIFGF